MNYLDVEAMDRALRRYRIHTDRHMRLSVRAAFRYHLGATRWGERTYLVADRACHQAELVINTGTLKRGTA